MIHWKIYEWKTKVRCFVHSFLVWYLNRNIYENNCNRIVNYKNDFFCSLYSLVILFSIMHIIFVEKRRFYKQRHFQTIIWTLLQKRNNYLLYLIFWRINFLWIWIFFLFFKYFCTKLILLLFAHSFITLLSISLLFVDLL